VYKSFATENVARYLQAFSEWCRHVSARHSSEIHGDGECLWQERRASSQGMDDEVRLGTGDDGQTDSGSETEADPMTFPLLPPEYIMIIAGMAVHADLRCIVHTEVLIGVMPVQGQL